MEDRTSDSSPRLLQGVFLREHPAPRGAEQVDAVEPRASRTACDLGDEEVESPERGVVGPVGLAAAELVVPDDLAARRRAPRPRSGRRRRAGAAVQAQERQRAGAARRRPVPGAVPAKRDEAFRHSPAAGTIRRTSTGRRKTTSSRTGPVGRRSRCPAPEPVADPPHELLRHRCPRGQADSLDATEPRSSISALVLDQVRLDAGRPRRLDEPVRVGAVPRADHEDEVDLGAAPSPPAGGWWSRNRCRPRPGPRSPGSGGGARR